MRSDVRVLRCVCTLVLADGHVLDIAEARAGCPYKVDAVQPRGINPPVWQCRHADARCVGVVCVALVAGGMRCSSRSRVPGHPLHPRRGGDFRDL